MMVLCHGQMDALEEKEMNGIVRCIIRSHHLVKIAKLLNLTQRHLHVLQIYLQMDGPLVMSQFLLRVLILKVVVLGIHPIKPSQTMDKKQTLL